MPTLPTIEELQTLAEQYSREKFPSKHREHLGISIIGEECYRKIWYTFRWVKLEQAEGRMRRLWQRGHREEPIFRDFLFWCGFHKRDINTLTGNRYKASSVNGHYGGTPDDVWVHNSDESFRIIAEYKTYNNKWFNDLKDKRLKIANPKHYAQMCGYGENFQISKALYFAVNKDNDEWYPEWVELDWLYGKELEKKAETIIYAKTPPNRISEQPSYWKCKFCTFLDMCHHGECVEENCRSCRFAEPAPNAEWYCQHWKSIIPKEWIAKGCPEHKSINDTSNPGNNR